MNIASELNIMNEGLRNIALKTRMNAINIANVDTPNFHALMVQNPQQDVSLPLRISDKKHFTNDLNGLSKRHTIDYQHNREHNLDNNDVDLNKEREDLVRNVLLHQLKISEMTHLIRDYKKAIGDN